MMWSVGILLATALSVESYTDNNERLEHGRQLKIYLPKSAEKLVFTPAKDFRKTFIYWQKSSTRATKGRVSGTGTNRRWYIDKVTFEDQGTYTQKDYWNKELSSIKVAVTYKIIHTKCVAGENLYIQLEGIALRDATLSFRGEAANVTLVRNGAPVSQKVPDYWDRVKTHSRKIEISNVNYSDVGHYTLRDRENVVSVTKMLLTDHRDDSKGNPLWALLLLLGIPAGICCCCRKKIFKKEAAAAAKSQSSPDAVHPPPSGPLGPSPPYNTPGQPVVGPSFHPPPATGGPGQWNGPPPSSGYNPGYPTYPPQNPGYPPQDPTYPPQNPGYPPQNPAYPPGGPAMIPPTQPPQWNGPPAGHYPTGPAAPMA